MDKLTRIFLNGFKSFRFDARSLRDGPDADQESQQESQRDRTIEFGDLTVLLGANGAGKSNLVSFFRMLSFLTSGALQEYIGRTGGAGSLVHYGPQVTPRLQARVEFRGDDRRDSYSMTLAEAAPDTLVFTREECSHHESQYAMPHIYNLGSGHMESHLKEVADGGGGASTACRGIHGLLSRCRTYQFHDTSPTARIRKEGYVEDAGFLRGDAGNLAAYLLTLRETERRYYDRIVETIRQVFPQFGDFVLELRPLNTHNTLLNWRERNRPEYLFGPHQLSDGTLRFMALATLFLQPPEKLPAVIVIDEPELGLHPYAITVLAGIIKAESSDCQVILSTQSTRLVDEFDVDQIVVVERDKKDNCTRTHRPDAKALKEWIQEYTTSELWEKNVLGGRP
jgi:predicted ATPase